MMLHKKILRLECFLKSEDRHKFSQISDKLLEKQFTIRDIGVTHRWITHWDEGGLLPGETIKGKWRKFNFIEYTWLKIIMEGRKYNFPLKPLYDLKELLLSSFDFEEAIKNPAVRQAILKRTPIEKRDKVEAFINDKNLIRKAALENRIEICLLHLFILDVIVLKSHFALLINSKGDFIPLKESYILDYYEIPGFSEFMHKSYLSISITEIIKNYIVGKDLILVNNKLALLTNEEAEVIKAIREQDLISVNVRFDKKNQIDLIEMTKEQKIKKESRFLDVIMSNGYQEIIVKTEKGNIVRCMNKLKKKL